jgi:hypothetical protein
MVSSPEKGLIGIVTILSVSGIGEKLPVEYLL